jgi:membrane associated rhomboid family serine protease
MIGPTKITEGIVYRTKVRASCDENAMVLEAVGIDSEVLHREGSFLLIVRPEEAVLAKEQLHLYSLENRKKLKSETPGLHLSKGLYGALLYVVVLLLVNSFQHNKALNVHLIGIGGANAGLIQQGEWWRAVTALTLHSDLLHLIGNLGFGVLFGLFASQHLGSGLAWFSILMAGALGNIINAFIQTSTHTTIGASTAVFAALGIQASYTWRTRHHSAHQGMRRWAPIIGGVMLLSFLGGPGERVDVASHITGFLSGISLGFVFGSLGSRLMLKARYQAMLGVASITIIALAWLVATHR